jgi:CSLREA domain-containing protein
MRMRLLIAGLVATISSLLLSTSAMAGIQLTVDTTADNTATTDLDGHCTLREAVNASNASTTVGTADCPSSGTPSVNQIGFAAALGANPVINLTAFGDLQFGTNNVTVTGPATVNGASHFRVINSNATNLTLTSLTISNGSEDTQGRGGGIANVGGGQLVLNNSTVSGNSTTKPAGSNIDVEGGGIYSTGKVTLNNSAVTNNQAVATCSPCSTGSLSLGGGVESSGAGAGLTMENSIASGNKAIATGDGTGGVEADGGGVRTDGNVLIEHSTVSGNLVSATSSAGSSAGQETVQGGGMLFHGSTATIDVELSTIANNLMKAPTSTGAAQQRGGGIENFSTSTANYISDTIVGNGLDLASQTAGIQGLNFQSANVGAGSRTFENTIIANPVGSMGSNCFGNTPYPTSGAPNDDFPLNVPNACFAAGMAIMNTDPLLGSLGPNGGSTSTMVPSATSPVIDQGDASDQNDLTEDQRGLTRPVVFSGLTHPFDGSDIGAVEVQATCTGQPTPGGTCPSSGGGGQPPATPPAATPTKKKCKKAKKGASSAKKKKCKKKKK